MCFRVDSLDQDLVPYVIRQQFKGPDVLAKYVKDPIGPTETQVSSPCLHILRYSKTACSQEPRYGLQVP